MSKGVESIRIKGQRIEELPLGMGNEAKAQLPMAIEAERVAAIESVNAEFPKHRIDYLVSRIKECNENKTRMNVTIDSQNTMISDYKGHIAMCSHRDTEVAKLEQQEADCGEEISLSDKEDFKAKKKALFKQFLPYNVAAMEQQIVQCQEAIGRCNDVKDTEDKSIAEFTAVHAQCKERDKQLAKLGAVAEGS